jgi:hypothetical protein
MIDERLVGLEVLWSRPTGSSVHPLACKGLFIGYVKRGDLPVAPLGRKETSRAKGGDPSNFLDFDVLWREKLPCPRSDQILPGMWSHQRSMT